MASGIVTDAFLDAVRARRPELRLLTDEADREGYRRDETAYLTPGLPGAVALPTETAQVVDLVKLCGEFDESMSREAFARLQRGEEELQPA